MCENGIFPLISHGCSCHCRWKLRQYSPSEHECHRRKQTILLVLAEWEPKGEGRNHYLAEWRLWLFVSWWQENGPISWQSAIISLSATLNAWRDLTNMVFTTSTVPSYQTDPSRSTLISLLARAPPRQLQERRARSSTK